MIRKRSSPFAKALRSLWAALMAKDSDQRIDVLAITSAEQAAMMKARGFKVLSTPIGPISLIPDSANADSPLAKPKVREAISYAINREAIVKARGSEGLQASSIITISNFNRRRLAFSDFSNRLTTWRCQTPFSQE